MAWVEFTSIDVGFKAEGVGGGIAGEVFFRVAHTFCFKGAPFLSCKDKEVRKENPAILQSKEEMF